MRFHPMDDPALPPVTAHSAAAGPGPCTPPLEGSASADIAIIGGGITGLSAALHAIERGARVMLVEANTLGWGASGRTFGQVVPYLRHEPEDALRILGPDRGERLLAAATVGCDLVFNLIERHGMTRTGLRSGLLFAANTPAALERLRRRAVFWRDRHVDVSMLDAATMAALVGGGTSWGGLLEPRGGTISALRYVRGLAQACIRKGVFLHERTAVQRVTRSADVWLIETPTARVVATTILVCTNAYNRLFPALQGSIIPIRVHGAVSARLPPTISRTILPEGHAVTDSSSLPSGLRLTSDGRLHVSHSGNLFGAHRTTSLHDATRKIRTIFPQIPSLTWDSSWSGWVAMTTDQVPHLHRLGPGLIAGLGYSGRGIALATLMGREMARLAIDAHDDAAHIPVSNLRGIGIPAWLARRGVQVLALTASVRDCAEKTPWGGAPQP